MNVSKKIVIFGANGWVGKALLDFLLNHFLWPLENIIAISSSTKVINLIDGKKIKCFSLEEALKINVQDVIFFHLSFLVRYLLASTKLEEYLKGNLKIRNDALKLIEHFKPSKIIYSSSGAVYEKDGAGSDQLEKNPYGHLKKQDEIFFADLARSRSISLLVPRIFNIAGPYINKLNIYAISDFIIQATETEQIIIKAKHLVVRSYIHIFDLVKIFLNWAEEKTGEDFFIFDSANNDVVELGELANLVNQTLNLKAKIIREFNDNLASDYYVGDITKQNILTTKYNIKLQSHLDCVKTVYEYLVKDEKITITKFL